HTVDASREVEIQLDVPEYLTYDGRILSTATEINTPNSQLANIDGIYKSAYLRVELNVNLPNTALFTSPHVYNEKLDIITFTNSNNNDTGETGDAGNCTSKHISKSFTFANNGAAEALRVYGKQHRPLGTNVEIYARLWNFNDPESFSTKLWTPLVITSGNGIISSTIDIEDFYDVTYELPTSPSSAYTLPGTVTITTGNVSIATSNDTSANISARDLIKIYNPTTGFANAV